MVLRLRDLRAPGVGQVARRRDGAVRHHQPPPPTTFAFRSAARMLSTKAFTDAACWWRATSVERIGGCQRPKRGSSPPFELKWLTITISVLSFQTNSPASGLRVASQAG